MNRFPDINPARPPMEEDAAVHTWDNTWLPEPEDNVRPFPGRKIWGVTTGTTDPAPARPPVNIDVSVRDGLDFYVTDKDQARRDDMVVGVLRVAERVINMLRAREGLHPLRVQLTGYAGTVEETEELTEPGSGASTGASTGEPGTEELSADQSADHTSE